MTTNLIATIALAFIAGFSAGAAFILFAVRRPADTIVYLFWALACIITLIYRYAIGALV